MDIIDLKDIFEKYRVYKLRINNQKELGFIVDINPKEIENNINKWTKFVEIIEKILNDLDEEYSSILKQIYIENKKRQELPYSESTFYWKHKKATASFLKYLRI